MRFTKYPLRSPRSPSGGKAGCDGFLGINAGEQGASLSRAACLSFYNGQAAPGAVNMIRKDIGQVAKRPGFSLVNNPSRLTTIDGVFYFKESDKSERYFFVAGSEIFIAYPSYSVQKIIYANGVYNKPRATQMGKYMFIIGSSALCIYNLETDEETYFNYADSSSVMQPDMSYLPTTHIAGLPNGSASPYQSANILNPFVAEQYISDGKSTEYTIHFAAQSVFAAYVKDDAGEWKEVKVASNTQNTVTFESPPPLPTVAGEDNVRIVYKRHKDTLKYNRITGCKCMTAFGVGGFEDRLFLSGNDFRPGYVYYSEMNNPMYIPETNYIRVGDDATVVCALKGIGTKLHVICNDNIYCVSGKSLSQSDDSTYVRDSVFTVTDILKTPPAIRHDAVVFDGEINYLTKSGVCAITPSGIVDERCCQIRSENINPLLLKEDLSDCKMIDFGNYLIISNRKDTLYVLDGLKFQRSENAPFSSRQYECYVFKGIPAKHLWKHGEKLYFSDGKNIFCFEKDFEGNLPSCDILPEGERAVEAYWETPDINVGHTGRNKFFMSLCLKLGKKYKETLALCNTDVKISALFDNDDWRTVKEYDGMHRIFDYADIDFSKFSYLKKRKSFNVFVRNLHKKAKSIRFRFENNNMNESFIMDGFEVDYKQM